MHATALCKCKNTKENREKIGWKWKLKILGKKTTSSKIRMILIFFFHPTLICSSKLLLGAGPNLMAEFMVWLVLFWGSDTRLVLLRK